MDEKEWGNGTGRGEENAEAKKYGTNGKQQQKKGSLANRLQQL